MKRVQRDYARSLPYKRAYIWAVFLSAIQYICILGTLTTIVLFILQPSLLATRVLIAFIIFSSITWLLAFFKRRSTHCPLCKGTPLINSGALVHQKATKIWPLNHGISAILSIIITQKFRCMYCGTAFDLMKKPSHIIGKDTQNYSDEHAAYTADDRS